MSEAVAETEADIREMGDCEKCMSEIPIMAERCPDCGYEPSSHGIVGGLLLGLLLVSSILLAGFIMIIWVAAIASAQFGISGALTLTAVVGIFLAPMVWIVWKSANAERKTATGHIRDWDEVT
ncbi:hypothetical protein [Halorubellus sp. PRR65]|uniref:hypothetical protein n=1 Tax=Halorubellus sp. PRR65 TaxID=3098148 RepID=UPI002B25A953|nr:hypothetical protein [Halorubellus sp. PRR65]